MHYVTEFTAATPDIAEAHFLIRLSLETDCADVHDSLAYVGDDFVLLHVVGCEENFARRYIPGAIHLPHKQMTSERMAQWSKDTLFVVYCAGPHCNGADRAALKLAQLGRPVKIMLGGITGWEDEGYAFATGK
ncbi:rhodanese-like domain-containing protein [Escherichia coli]|nr:rhodanese-like domain-containing protein [Escherichia coli]EJB8602614.1 rhodanese-like domain-containing protein [Escherichia coli]EJG7182762.1 rhodanese-like domain-containing protein [Escherichia coli]EKI8676976.1 rhodanese-like domain-containing protein [Escherichia coli]ELD5870497.1 rhodanese-like domain-containing protein [Escherichia coli]